MRRRSGLGNQPGEGNLPTNTYTMNTINQIRAEIERRLNNDYCGNDEQDITAQGVCCSLLFFLDTLKEQSVELEKEIERISKNEYFDFSDWKTIARHFYELGRQSLKDKDTFDEVDDAILEFVIRAVQERKDEDTGYEKHYDRLLNWLGELPNWVRCKPKVSDGLEEEMDKYFEKMPVKEHENIFEDTFQNIARHFAKWGAEHRGSSEIPNDLEEASDEYAEKHGFRVPYDGSDNFYDDVDVKASKEGFKAGAKWMLEKMLKEAVEGTMYEEPTGTTFVDCIVSFPAGKYAHEEKVKLIIIKEDTK